MEQKFDINKIWYNYLHNEVASISVFNHPTTVLLAWHSWELLRWEKPEYLSLHGPSLFSVIFITDNTYVHTNYKNING